MGENGNGSRPTGNLQLNANTGVTIGLVIVLFAATVATVYKASEVVTNMDYLKLYVNELRVEVAAMKRIIERIDRKQGNGGG